MIRLSFVSLGYEGGTSVCGMLWAGSQNVVEVIPMSVFV